MLRKLSAWAALLLAAHAQASPQEDFAIALADARSLQPPVAYTTRYIGLSHFSGDSRASRWATFFGSEPEKVVSDREFWRLGLSFHVNSLSRYPLIVPPRVIGDGKVLAINLADYGISPKTWDRLAIPDPYFHVRVAGEKDGRKVIFHKYDVPWIDTNLTEELSRLTDAQAALVRGDWFFWQTAAQIDRDPGYYDLLGLGKDLKDFWALIGADPDLARKSFNEDNGAVGFSSVTLNNRGVVRLGAASGGYWFTKDFKSSRDRSNTLRVPLDLTKPDASEQYGFLPNRLFTVWLNNDQEKGGRQDQAPDFIAGHRKAPNSDTRVHIYWTCMSCHVEGLRPIGEYYRLTFRGSQEVRSPDPHFLKKESDKYFTDIDWQLARDREQFARAVKEVNGLTIAENARLVGAMWAWYSFSDDQVTAEQAAVECGLPYQEFRARLDAFRRREAVYDPVLGAYMKNPPGLIRREHFEELFPFLMKALGLSR